MTIAFQSPFKIFADNEACPAARFGTPEDETELIRTLIDGLYPIPTGQAGEDAENWETALACTWSDVLEARRSCLADFGHVYLRIENNGQDVMWIVDMLSTDRPFEGQSPLRVAEMDVHEVWDTELTTQPTARHDAAAFTPNLFLSPELVKTVREVWPGILSMEVMLGGQFFLTFESDEASQSAQRMPSPLPETAFKPVFWVSAMEIIPC